MVTSNDHQGWAVQHQPSSAPLTGPRGELSHAGALMACGAGPDLDGAKGAA